MTKVLLLCSNFLRSWLFDAFFNGQFLDRNFIGDSFFNSSGFNLLFVCSWLDSSKKIDFCSYFLILHKAGISSPNDARNIIRFIEIWSVDCNKNIADFSFKWCFAIDWFFANITNKWKLICLFFFCL